MRSKKKEKKNLLVSIGLLIIVLMFLFLIFEISLRLFYPMQTEFKQFHPYLVYEKIPNWEGYFRNPQFLKTEYLVKTKFNSFGLNDYETNTNQLKKEDTILFLGDSFTYGYGVETKDSAPQITEIKLRKDLDKDIEVINAGTGSYNLGSYLNYIKYEAEPFNTSIVVVGFFMGNDLGAGATHLYKEQHNQLVEKTPLLPYSTTMKIRRFLLQKSHAYAFTLSAISNTIIGDFLRERKIFAPYHAQVLNDLKQYQENQLLNKLLIKEIKKETKKRNQQLLFVLIPFKEQVDDQHYQQTYPNGSEIDRFQLQEDVSRILEKNNINYLNPLNIYRKLNKNNTFYYNLDGHFNKKGYHLLGVLTAEEIKKLFYTQNVKE